MFKTPERMMARLLAYCMNAEQPVTFTRGLSSVEEPDIWAHTLDDRISLWIDMGEPSFDRIKKAVRISEKFMGVDIRHDGVGNYGLNIFI